MSNPLRELVFARSEGVCQCEGACGLHEGRCTTSITLETFHRSHLRSRAHGGVDHESNLEAWCSRCNLTLQARDARDPRLMPREWQLRELDKIVQEITRTGAATLSAAPGAGKTVFASLVFEALRDAGVVERMIVLVPRRGLGEQWVDALAASRHIQLKPHSADTRPGQDGVVVTYQSLSNRNNLEAHMLWARRVPTLLVLDEVHHLARDAQGTHQAWADAIAELAGDVDSSHLNVAGVLNLSGTLWRSDPGERISTVRYSPPDAEGRIVSRVDGEATVQELIAAGELRSVDLYRLDAHVQVEDHATIKFVEGNLSDVDAKVARAAVAHISEIDSWRSVFVASVLDKIEWAHRATDHHIKGLIVANRQDQAVLFRNEVNRQMRERGLQPLAALAITNNPDEDADAQRTLESFRAQRRVGVLCTVDMAGEGYDCPDIAVLGYASNKLTSLYVRQVTARAMRVTDRERELGVTLPAIVVLPDAPALVDEFLAYLTPALHEVRALEKGDQGIREREGLGGLGGPRLRRFVLADAHAGAERATVIFTADGSHENIDSRYAAELAGHLAAVNLPEVFHARAVGVFQRTIGDLLQIQRDRRPFDTVIATEATLEQQAAMVQADLDKFGGWWAINGDTPPSHFNQLINESAGIPNGKRGSASIEQLERARRFAKQHITDYRRRRGMES